nr:serine/arginine-rich splicing factor 2-like [Dermacentor andersoni]
MVRSDVCPTPDAKACRQCGARNPPEGHQCQPKCLVCGGDHATGSRDCKERLKQFKELRGPAYGGRQSRQKSRSGQQQQQHRKRWLSLEGDQSQSRNQSQERRGSSRSRSRNSSRSRSRTNAPQSCQGIKGGKQQP